MYFLPFTELTELTKSNDYEKNPFEDDHR